MAPLDIPQSVFDYMTKDGIRSAVDHLLASRSSDFPEEINSWDETRNYHRALLAAYQVRQEHIIFLIDLWDAVWGRALQEAGSTLEIVPFLEQHKDDSLPSPDFFWLEANAHFRRVRGRSFGFPVIELGIEYWSEGIQLYVYRDPDLIADLPSPWTSALDKDGCRSTETHKNIPSEPSLGGMADKLVAAAKAALSCLEM